MKFNTLTLKDIATAMGLSTATISRALRNGYEISEVTKAKVLAYTKSVNYSPNPIAKSLKRSRSFSIGVIVSELANDFSSQLINGIESVAFYHKYNLVISQSQGSAKREKQNIDYLASRSIDGLVVALSNGSENVAFLRSLNQKGLPIIFVDQVPETVMVHKVSIDNFEATIMATRHLIQNGKKRIVYMSNSNKYCGEKQRLAGYKKVLVEFNIDYNADLVRYCFSSSDLARTVQDIMNLQPDGILIATELLSLNFMEVLKKMYPEKTGLYSIAGFTNSDLIDIFNPQIAAVRQPALMMGQLATKCLLEMIQYRKSPDSYEHIVLEAELIVN